MRKLRILPGAAGIIALTATIGFVDGQREIEVEGFSRGRITLVSPHILIATDASSAVVKADIKTDNPAYQVEIIRGNTFSTVLIDAVTGRILLS